MQIKTEILSANDVVAFSRLVTLFGEVFEMQNFRVPAREHLQKILRNEKFISIAATLEEEIAGGLTIYVLDHYYAEKPLAYIYDLAVAKKFQRMGIGSRLIAHAIEYCRSKGFRELFVQVENLDDDALQFYRSTTFSTEDDVRHFTYRL